MCDNLKKRQIFGFSSVKNVHLLPHNFYVQALIQGDPISGPVPKTNTKSTSLLLFLYVRYHENQENSHSQLIQVQNIHCRTEQLIEPLSLSIPKCFDFAFTSLQIAIQVIIAIINLDTLKSFVGCADKFVPFSPSKKKATPKHFIIMKLCLFCAYLTGYELLIC